MKELNLYKIKEMALDSGRAVYSAQQLANLLAKPKNIAKVYLWRLVQKGLSKKLFRGRVSFIDDDYIIASQLSEPCYISLSSALLFHGLVRQVPRYVECVTSKNSRNYNSLGVIYHKIPPALMYGYAKLRKAQSYIFVAEPEKAVIDSLYLNQITGKAARELLPNLDFGKLEGYAMRFNGRGANKLRKWLHAQKK